MQWPKLQSVKTRLVRKIRPASSAVSVGSVPDLIQAASGNGAYDWSKFDSEAYFQHYYGDPHPDDERVIECAVAAFKALDVPPEGLDIVDVGTGPNLIPFFCAAPCAHRLTAWEYSESNTAWLNAELYAPVLRPQWQHFWRVTRKAYGSGWTLPENPIPVLRPRSIVHQGSVFDLPPHRWDAATMFFCAESITEKFDEFDAAVRAFCACVKPGGALLAAFLVRSAGYEVNGRRFPVLRLSAEQIETVFGRYAANVRCERIGIVEQEIRSGYSGFVFLTGTAPSLSMK
jgi:NNMT/PNMT/TEMT family